MGIKFEGAADRARLQVLVPLTELLHSGVVMGSPQGVRDELTRLRHEHDKREEPTKRQYMADVARRAEVPYGFPDDDGWAPPRKARTLADAVREGTAMPVKEDQR